MRLHLILDQRTGTLLHIFQDHTQFSNKKRDMEMDGRLIRTESWYTSDKEKAPEPKSEGYQQEPSMFGSYGWAKR